MNLTGIAEPERMIIDLFLDSLIAVPHIPPSGRMLDVGSGAGFPAVVIKLLIPDLRLSLVEANSKKVSFLKQVARLLKLDGIEVINGRIELIKDNLHPDGFDVISSRALADLNRIINWCASLLAAGGRLVYFSGSRVDEVLENSKYVMSDNNLTVDHLVPYHLPGMKENRSIVILRKEITK
jgi:16S rRNA (guanine527-N7)-methyltransferase